MKRSLLDLGFSFILGAVILLYGRYAYHPFAAAGDTVITVTTAVDEITSNGNCSLREAVMAANSDTAVDNCPAGSGVDTIELPAGTFTLALAGKGEDAAATGDLDILAPVTIKGVSADATIIDGAGIDRLFHLAAPAAVTLNNLTLREGNPHVPGSTGPAYSGGAIALGSGSDLTLEQIRVTQNSAYSGGGHYNNGGALTLTATKVLSNSADYAGGIASMGILTLMESTIDSNSAAYYAGGIQSEGALDMARSTVSRNHAGTNGGGLYLPSGAITITNSTVSGNRINGYMGGGVWVYYQADTALNFINVTIIDNYGGSGVYTYHEGAAGELPAPIVFFKNSLLAMNLPGNCGRSANAPLMGSLGHNLESGDTCNFHSTGDLINTPASTGPLQDNTGPTWTHLPEQTSAVVDAAEAATCPATDQRGFIRPQGAGCDIGAVEVWQGTHTIYLSIILH